MRELECKDAMKDYRDIYHEHMYERIWTETIRFLLRVNRTNEPDGFLLNFPKLLPAANLNTCLKKKENVRR